MGQGLPNHESWADTMKLFKKVVLSRKSKAQVARAEYGKTAKAKKVREAKLRKEAKPQLTNLGITAADLPRDARRADAHKHRAGSWLVLSGAIHVVGSFPPVKISSECEMWDWMDKHKVSKQDAIACSDGRDICAVSAV